MLNLHLKTGERKLACPGCYQVKVKLRRLPVPTGYDPKLKHYRCDVCRLEWYEMPGATGKVYGLTCWTNQPQGATGS